MLEKIRSLFKALMQQNQVNESRRGDIAIADFDDVLLHRCERIIAGIVGRWRMVRIAMLYDDSMGSLRGR